MKKITFILLFATSTLFAQQTDSLTKKKSHFEWYFGFGAAFHPDYNINSKLAAAGVKELPGVTPSTVIGWNVTFEDKYLIGMELGSNFTLNNRKKDGSQLMQLPIKLRGQYIFADAKKLQFMAGVDITYTGSVLNVFSDATEIDMNNINPTTNTGFIPFRNDSFFVGPSASLSFKDNKGYRSFVVNVGYDICFTNSKWRSDYAKITNPVRENGSRFFANITIPVN